MNCRFLPLNNRNWVVTRLYAFGRAVLFFYLCVFFARRAKKTHSKIPSCRRFKGGTQAPRRKWCHTPQVLRRFYALQEPRAHRLEGFGDRAWLRQLRRDRQRASVLRPG